jgi:hypothetical protein
MAWYIAGLSLGKNETPRLAGILRQKHLEKPASIRVSSPKIS